MSDSDMLEKEAVFLHKVVEDKDSLIYALTHVQPNDLTCNNAIVYNTIHDLFTKQGGVSYAAIIYHLNEANLLGEIGGSHYIGLIENVDFQIDSLSFNNLCEELKTVGQTRRIKSLLNGLVHSDDIAPEDLVGNAIDGLYGIIQDDQKDDIISIGDLVAELDSKVRTPCISSGIENLDTLLGGGLFTNDYNIIAARPSVGKTAYALQLAIFSALSGKPTTIFSLEQGKSSLVDRLKRFVPKEELVKLPLYICAKSQMTISKIFADAQIAKLMYGVKVIIVDYIGLIDGKYKGESSNDFIGRLSRSFQHMARKLDVVLIVISQLNRDSERENRGPELHDLRDSGSLEQDADNVFLIDRPKKGETAHIRLAKHREGPIGGVTVRFDPKLTMFMEI